MSVDTSSLESQHSDWPDLDLSLLDARRGPVPNPPLELVPQPWRDWISATAAARGVPEDYLLQSVLAGVAAVCGAGVQVRVTPDWSEPLVLWQAVVGESSAGKSGALAPMRRLLGEIEAERRLHDEERRGAWAQTAGESQPPAEPFVASQVILPGADLAAATGIVSGNPRGLLLWCDGITGVLGAEEVDEPERAAWTEAWVGGAVTVPRGRKPARELASFPVSILQTLRPERITTALQEGDEGIAARFLYAWPGPRPYRALAEREPALALDDEVLRRLRHLSRLARTPDDPHEIPVDPRGLAALDGVLAALHAERSEAEGLQAAWLGRAASTIVRLAAILELLTVGPPLAPGRPGALGSEQMLAAARLWTDYFAAHARAAFDGAELRGFDRQVRRAARWLRDTQASVVSREDIRRRALSYSVDASETNLVLYRLAFLGFVRAEPGGYRAQGGRPASRWQVHPALARP